MKTTWILAALAGSVSLGNAQQATTRPPAPVNQPATPARAPRPAKAVVPGAWELTPEAPVAVTLPSLDVPLPLLPLEAPMALAAPMVTPAPMVDITAPLPALSGQWPSMTIETPIAPFPAEPPALGWPQGQGPTAPPPVRSPRAIEADVDRFIREVDRAEAARIRSTEAQDRAAQRQVEQLANQAIRQLEQQERTAQRQQEQLAAQVIRDLEQQERQQERLAQQAIRQQEMQERQAQRALDLAVRTTQGQSHATVAHVEAMLSATHDYSITVRSPWAPQDVADSAYRVARELVNRGEWGQAVQAFRSIQSRYPNSAYAPDAAYYQAFALYRIGGMTELREALSALEAQKAKYPNAGSRTEAATLATRVRGVLAARGDAQAAAELKATATSSGGSCDREEQTVQAEAMNALSRSDAGNVNDLITRVLARKDECAVPLRRTAVFLVGNRRDAQAVSILAGVARNDPSVDVRVEAIGVIGRLPNEDGVAVLEQLTRADDERVQRAAVRSLVRHPSARARTSVRGLVERDDVSEKVRAEALSAFDAERATADDVAWLRALYAKVTTPSLKARTLSAIVRVGGPEVDQWLATIARDDNQPSEIRSTAMRRIGETMSVADLAKLYDGATQQRFRSEIISVLGKRKDDAATDKLIDIIKNGTDPQLRRSAISAVASKNDARATQLLLEIINK